MDQKPFSQLPQKIQTARFAVPSVAQSSLGSVPGTQIVQQPPQRQLASTSLQSPPQSSGKVLTPGYPTTTTPTQVPLSIKAEPGLTTVVDTSALTGTIVSIKDESVANPTPDVDTKPNCSGAEPDDMGNPSSLELDDVKPDRTCVGMPTSTKAPIAKKCEKLSYINVSHQLYTQQFNHGPISQPAAFRVPPGHGKSWNLQRPFSRPEKSWKIAKVMKNHGK